MLHPSYTDLMKAVNREATENGEQPIINSRYSIVIATSRRARQLIEERGEEGMANCFKPLSVAVDELNKGEITIVSEEDCAEEDIDLNAGSEETLDKVATDVYNEEDVQPQEAEEDASGE